MCVCVPSGWWRLKWDITACCWHAARVNTVPLVTSAHTTGPHLAKVQRWSTYYGFIKSIPLWSRGSANMICVCVQGLFQAIECAVRGMELVSMFIRAMWRSSPAWTVYPATRYEAHTQVQLRTCGVILICCFAFLKVNIQNSKVHVSINKKVRCFLFL